MATNRNLSQRFGVPQTSRQTREAMVAEIVKLALRAYTSEDRLTVGDYPDMPGVLRLRVYDGQEYALTLTVDQQRGP